MWGGVDPFSFPLFNMSWFHVIQTLMIQFYMFTFPPVSFLIICERTGLITFAARLNSTFFRVHIISANCCHMPRMMCRVGTCHVLTRILWISPKWLWSGYIYWCSADTPIWSLWHIQYQCSVFVFLWKHKAYSYLFWETQLFLFIDL